MNITVRGATEVKRLLAHVEKQMPYARASALNSVGGDAYDAIRQHVASRFIVRAPQFINGRFRLAPADRATKTKGKVTIALRRFSMRELSPRGILGKFVDGGTKGGSWPNAIPTRAIRPDFRQLVPRYLFPKALGLEKNNYLGNPKGMRRKKAGIKDRFFYMKRGAKGEGIWRAGGPGKGWLELIWAFRRTVNIPKRLPFDDIVQRVVTEKWTLRMSQAMQAALATADYKGVYGPRTVSPSPLKK